MIVILIGKSASGKDTIAKELCSAYNYKPIISTTTRPMRVGEKDGREYNFIDRKTFEKKIKEDKFLEYRKYDTFVNGNPDVWYYGSEKQNLLEDENYLIILDVKGAKEFSDYYKSQGNQILPIYIDADDNLREKRAMVRGSFDKIEWDRRKATDKINFSPEALSVLDNYYTITNDKDISLSVSFIHDIVNSYDKEIDKGDLV